MKLMAKRYEKGSTILEILAAVAIMGILAVAIGPQYAKNRNAKSLSYAKTQITNDIRYAQSYTLSTKRFPDNTSPTGGFGIHFEKGSPQYVIFGDKAGGGNPNQQYDGVVELFETSNLVDGVTITNLRVKRGGSWGEVSSVDFISQPPYGKIIIDKAKNEDYAATGGIALEITYENSASGSGTVTLTGSGLIN